MEYPIARVLPLLSPAHLDRDFDYLVPLELDELAQPGVRVRVRFAGRLVDGYLLERRTHSDHGGKLVKLERVVSGERVLTPEIVRLTTAVAARYAGTRADVLRLAIPPRHARTETGGTKKKSATSQTLPPDEPTDDQGATEQDAAPPSHPEQSSAPEPEPGQSDSTPSKGSVIGGGPAGSVDAQSISSVSSGESAVEAISDAVDAAGSSRAEREPPAPSEHVVADVAGRGGSEVAQSDSPAVPRGAVPQRVSGAALPRVDGESSGSPEHAGGQVHSKGEVVAEAASPGTGEPAASAVDSAGVEGGAGGGAVAGSAGVEGGAGGGAAADFAGVESGVDGGAAQAVSSDGAVAVQVPEAWYRYVHGAAFVTALAQGKGPRAAWQALPGEDWPRRLAELAATVAGTGRSAILMVPDQRDLDRVLAECERLLGDSAVGLSAGLGPAARYRRWLSVLRGTARVVVGTRSAVFAPADNLGLLAIWDDGDDTYAEPRAPYPHAREVAMLRSHETGAAFVAAGFARTAEIQAVVETGWAHDLVADRAVVRKASPRISVPGDSDAALERDPVARAVRIPAVAFGAARSALREGAGVLVQVPRRGYMPALACAKCRTPARCRHCNGPLSLPDGRAGQRHSPEPAHSPSCRWCGITEAAFRCSACGSRALRAVVIGAIRTAEELGRAFPGVPIRGSSGGAMLDTVEPGPQVVVATVGAEPVLPGGYGVALLLDSWALLGRADLRAAEDALRRWMAAATLVRSHGQVFVVAEPSIPTVQTLVRWDPVGHARAELAGRAEVGFPPAVRMAAVDGTSESIAELLSTASLPGEVDVLGPVPLPPAARKPFSSGDSPAEVERILLRVDRKSGAALARALTAAQAIRSTHRSDAPLRIQIDPVDIG